MNSPAVAIVEVAPGVTEAEHACGAMQVQGTVTKYGREGCEVQDFSGKGKARLPVTSEQPPKKKSKFAEREPPATLKPNGHQVNLIKALLQSLYFQCTR